jgi:hypothetical protein
MRGQPRRVCALWGFVRTAEISGKNTRPMGRGGGHAAGEEGAHPAGQAIGGYPIIEFRIEHGICGFHGSQKVGGVVVVSAGEKMR